MRERAKEMAQLAIKWAGEAWAEWVESLQDSPPAHFYTLVLGVVLTLLAHAFL